MDTTKEYIKQCDCPEIQELRDYDNDDAASSDFVYNPNRDSVVVTGYYDEDGPYLRGDNPIWLPRQDQLQEMLELPYNQEFFKLWQVFFSYSDYVIQTETGFEMPKWAEHTESMEQLWLAFYMKTKYNKIWDGENWKTLE